MIRKLVALLTLSVLPLASTCDFVCGNPNGCDAGRVEDGSIVIASFRYGDIVTPCNDSAWIYAWFTTDAGWIKMRKSYGLFPIPQPQLPPLISLIGLVGL